jgi:glutathione S-transferase
VDGRLQHPKVAASSGLVYLIGRLIYFHGYTHGKPAHRYPGSIIGYLGMFTLLGTNLKCAASWAWDQISQFRSDKS